MSLPTQQQDEVRTTHLARPSTRIIAFAVAVVRSKPPEISISEFIRLLRQHIANGRRRDAVSANHQHLDRSAYWRSEYERTKDALKQAKDESITLRLEIESLKAKLETPRSGTASKKRKKLDEDVIPYPRSPKRSKRDPSPMKSAPESTKACLDNLTYIEFSKAGEAGNILLRSVFHVNVILKRRERTETPDLAYHIVSAASTITQIVEQELRRSATKETPDLALLEQTLTVAGRAIMFLLLGFTRLCTMIGSDALEGKVVYAIVRMFKDLIGGISFLSGHEVSTATSAKLVSDSIKKASAPKPKANTKAPKPAKPKENVVLGTYTIFLARVIEMVDSKIESNQSLFEGMAYCIFNKLGNRLFCTVFGHRRAPTLDEEILKNNKDDEIEDDEVDLPLSSDEIDFKQAELEAPYLIHLLNRIMIAAPSYLGQAVNSKSGKLKQPSGNVLTKGALAITAKECLQRTLINSIFGTEGVDQNDPFIDCLKMPVISEGAFKMPTVKPKAMQDWFKEEVWRLLGWDILERV